MNGIMTGTKESTDRPTKKPDLPYPDNIHETEFTPRAHESSCWKITSPELPPRFKKNVREDVLKTLGNVPQLPQRAIHRH